MYEEFRHPLVRDLAWAIASPPLLVPGTACCDWYGEAWYRQLYRESTPFLRRLDEQPGPLQARVDCQKDRRMGRYFETLWAYWLEHSERFEVLAHNLALRQGGDTLGEMDFIVLDKRSGRHLHWEMAVKFYLGLGDTRAQRNWHGPGKKDRLDKKVDHLSTRQSVISTLPGVRQQLADMGLRVDHCGVILKGRLFYRAGRSDSRFPVDACQEHERETWLTLSEFRREFAAGDRFYPLLGEGWMARCDYQVERNYISKNNMLGALSAARYRLPLYLDPAPDNEQNERIFLVGDDWSEVFEAGKLDAF